MDIVQKDDAHEHEKLLEAFSRISDRRVRYFFSMLADCLADATSQPPPGKLEPMKRRRRVAA